MVKPQTSDIGMAYEYIRMTYKYILVTYEYIQVTNRGHTSTYK